MVARPERSFEQKSQRNGLAFGFIFGAQDANDEKMII
jgi:hypothetical protein